MFPLRSWRVGVTMFAAYVFVLSWFVGEEVQGGVQGGKLVGTERSGRTITSVYEGGRQIVYAAAADKGRVLSTIAWIALAAVVVMLVLELVRKPPYLSEIASETGGALFGGGFFGMLTGMPLAIYVLKPASTLVFWIALIPLLLILFAAAVAFGVWAEATWEG